MKTLNRPTRQAATPGHAGHDFVVSNGIVSNGDAGHRESAAAQQATKPLVILAACASLALGVSGCGFVIGSTVAGSGVVSSEARETEPFQAVRFSGALIAEVIAGEEASIEITTDDNLVPLVVTEVVNGELRVSMQRGSYSPSEGIKVAVTNPTIQGIEVSGACTVSVEAINEDRLTVDISGASKVTLEGRCRQLKADISGATKLYASELSTARIDADISGASQAHVLVTEEVHGDLSGASRLVYAGEPEIVDVEASGVSSISAE